MKRAIVRIPICLVMLTALAPLVPGPRARATADSGSPAEVKVTIDNFAFSPETLNIAAGTKVTWVNRDDVPHTVVATDGTFKSQALDTDEQFAFQFDRAGTYEYYCSVHPKMTGKVIVK